MEMGRPEYNRGNQQAIYARGPSPDAPAQEVLEDSPEKQFLRNGNREVDAKELKRQLPGGGTRKVRVNKVQRQPQRNSEETKSEEINAPIHHVLPPP
jgi:hypothetical protein